MKTSFVYKSLATLALVTMAGCAVRDVEFLPGASFAANGEDDAPTAPASVAFPKALFADLAAVGRLRFAARAAYERNELATAERLATEGLERAKGRDRALLAYEAAVAAARAGHEDAAASLLDTALASHPSVYPRIERDEALAAMRSRPAVAAALARASQAHAAQKAADHAELRRLYEEDLADRALAPKLEAALLAERDAGRRAAVDKLVAAGAPRTADDLFHAAWVLRRGEGASVVRASELAARAVALEPTFPDARALLASIQDRLLVASDKPQRFGTQLRVTEQGYELGPVSPETTDDERAAYAVAPLGFPHRAATLEKP